VPRAMPRKPSSSIRKERSKPTTDGASQLFSLRGHLVSEKDSKAHVWVHLCRTAIVEECLSSLFSNLVPPLPTSRLSSSSNHQTTKLVNSS
jgi:hypothetical protein